MAGRHAQVRRSIALLLAFVLLQLNTPLAAGAKAPSGPSAGVPERIQCAATPGGEAVIVGPRVELGVAKPERISLPLFVFDMGKAHQVKVKEIRISDPGGKVRATVHPKPDLKALSDVVRSKSELLSRLADKDKESASALLERASRAWISVPVEDLALADGTTTTFTAAATFDIGGSSVEAVLPMEVTVSALPVQSGWGAGDGHVHSSTWSVGSYTIAERASQAVESGQKWLIMTDHWNYIQERPTDDLADWDLYAQDCAAQETAYDIPVLPGLEIAAIGNRSHNLAYGLDTSSLPPGDELYPAAQLVELINNQNFPTSFAVAAHPYRAGLTYQDFSADFRAFELLSQATTASPSAVSKWFELLNASVARKIAGGYFPVGVANSDAHSEYPGDAGMSWIRSTTGFTRAGVLDAIRSGAVSASGRGDLGYFTLNGVEQGGVAPVCAVTTLELKITQMPRTGRKCTLISVRNRNNAEIWSISNPSETDYSTTIPRPTNDTFRVVKMTFANEDGTDPSDVWCNPVFIDMDANCAPVAQDDGPYAASEGTPLTVPAPGVLTNDTDADGDVLSATVASGPTHGTLALDPSGAFTYTPSEGYSGSDGFTYEVSDGKGGVAAGSVSIEVAIVNDTPTAASDSYSTPEDTPLSVPAPGVLANDSDPDGDALTATLASGPEHGTLSLSSTGAFTYTPSPGYEGPDDFSYVVSDERGGTAVGTAVIDVLRVWTHFDQTDARIKWRGAWKTSRSPAYSGGSARYSKNASARLTITFTGTAIRIIGARTPSGGLAKVSIDGAVPRIVSFASGSDATLYQQVVFAESGLTGGAHTLTLEVVRRKKSKDRVYVDSVDLIGTLRLRGNPATNSIPLFFPSQQLRKPPAQSRVKRPLRVH